MIIVKVMVRLDLVRVFLLFNKLVLNAMEMEKLLVKLVKDVVEEGSFKAMSQFQSKFQKV